MQSSVLPGAELPLREALIKIKKDVFQKLNCEFDLFRTWSSLVEKILSSFSLMDPASINTSESKQLTEIIIATLCMPEFQFYYTPFFKSISKNCYILGQWDNGLLLWLRQRNAWFDSLFGLDFPFEYAKYPYGDSMAILNHKQLSDLAAALRDTAPFLAGDQQLTACHSRFNDLAVRALEVPGHTLALSME